MTKWFRFYSEALRNPKVAALSDREFRLWVQLLSAASENEGRLPPAAELKHMLNTRLDHLLTGLKRLISTGLIDPLEDGYEPHNWNKFQYKSDTSTERVRQHRAKGNVSVTPPEADTEQKQKIEPLAQQPIAARAALPKDWLERCVEANGTGTGFREERAVGLMSPAPLLGLVEAGFDFEADIIAGIRAKPNPNARTWGYFVPQIRDYVAKRNGAAAAPKVEPLAVDWPGRMKVYRQDGTWAPVWGPKPGERGCRVPSELLQAAA